MSAVSLVARWLLAVGAAWLSILLVASPANAGTDDYPSKWRDVPQDSMFDDWREYNRECTSFAAWRLYSRNGFEMPFYANASDWGPKARALGYQVDTTPRVGSIAWSLSPQHVAWVEAVDGANVTIEDYNSDYTGHYGEPTVAASQYQYIHFRDLATADGSSATATSRRIGVLNQDGMFYVKDGDLTAPWVAESGTAKAIALSGDRIGVLNQDGMFYVKDGGLTAPWVAES